MIESHKVTSIIIDDPNVTIYKSFDGDMVFRDNFVPAIKLKDLVEAASGGNLVIDPAIVVLVETTDFTYISAEELYGADIPNNFAFAGSNKANIVVEAYDSNFEKIGLDTIRSKENSVYIKISELENVYLVMKRVA